MSSDTPKKTSYTQKLHALAARTGNPISELRLHLLQERFIATITNDTTVRSLLVFKGGFVSRTAYGTERFTNDVDATTRDIERAVHHTLSAVQHTNDEFWFEYRDREPLSEFQNEIGVRLRFRGGLGEKPNKTDKEAHVILDLMPICSETPILTESKSVLNLSPLQWQICTCEETVADKLHSLIKRHVNNTRAKDIYDLLILLPQTKSADLRAHVVSIFARTQTPFPVDLVKAMNSIETQMLRERWKSIQVEGLQELSFDEAWAQLLELLQKSIRPDQSFMPEVLSRLQKISEEDRHEERDYLERVALLLRGRS
jgi:predicted nucleotidyltransferase component of viral defense system